MATRIALCRDEWSAQLAPEIGGAILSLAWRDSAILRPTPAEAVQRGEVRRTACYPLVPYANRIARGRFRWAGRDHVLRANFPVGAHPLHGVGWRRPWQVERADEARCELRLAHRPQGEDALDWPFAFDAIETFTLTPQGLCISLEARNLEPAAVPLGFGLHPLFVRAGGEVLRFAAGGCWRNGEDELPAELVADPSWDHARGRPLGSPPLDNDFVGWDGVASIVGADGLEIRITASADLPVLRVFTPSGRDFFGVEPVSHIADAINRADLAAGRMALVPPGGRIGGSVTIGVEHNP